MAENVDLELSEEEGSDYNLSPTEYLAEQCFPLRDFELVKIYDYHIKILDELSNIHRSVANNTAPDIATDNSEEAQKMKRRATEFSTRFSRNHLYPLRRETRQVQSTLTSLKVHQTRQKEILRKKMTSAYQTALQAVQAYVSYACLPQNLQVHDKLKELIAEIKQLHNTCQNVLIPIQESVGHGNIDMMPKKCEQIMEILEKPVEKPKFTKQSKKKPKDLNVASSLAMYEPKLGNWSMKSQALARLKFGQAVKARRKKSAPVPQRASVEREAKGIRSAEAIPSSSSRKKVHRDQVFPEDDVETQIERYHLHSAKTMENIVAHQKLTTPSEEVPELRHLVQEALNHLDIGDETTAMAKIQQITTTTKAKSKSPSKPRNVGLFHFKSEIMDEPEHEKPPVTQEEVPKEKREKTKWPFATKKADKLTPLNISNETINEYVSYKKRFERKSKTPPDNKPWEVVSRVSDSMLDEILDEVLDELVDDEMLEGLYQNELKNAQ